ncbi:uncharacterized protein BX664DRAFT_329850 [Halteromyces radiatus]|uniref:uncharacterized protein n=1 Tax=Halteromyces radiatus TaxID=101107 RepID=UPI00221FCFEF|nr:uncharacterized protein BX664DRAFT_329850 [Halteromyces radiatus]KAI8093495.1 hypothetical protein BX664DRAFT_329850 [Halteromyces radiatus]
MPNMKDVITAVDFLDEQQQLERDAQETLPGKFEKCTFDLGYIRQPLFACKTCSAHSNDNDDNDAKDLVTKTTTRSDTFTQVGGMCYSCSIACHADHDLYELFPKRHFRCDCGVNNKFGQHACELSSPTKNESVNDENQYNHNFVGRYCRCDQLYDPSVEEETMYQCALCEDWFHERCIGNIPEDIEDFESYICRECVTKHPFLANVDRRFSIGVCTPDKPVHRWIRPTTTVSATPQSKNDQNTNKLINTNDSTNSDASLETTDILTSSNTIKRNWNDAFDQQITPEDDNQVDIKKPKCDDCKNVCDILTGDEMMELFLADGWREGLCHCPKCSERYKQDKIEFILKEEKTFEPEDDEDAGKSLLQIGMEQLGRMNRVEALDGLRLYQNLSDQLMPFLRRFQESGQVVTEQDIRNFFDEKRREREEERIRQLTR